MTPLHWPDAAFAIALLSSALWAILIWGVAP